VDFVGEDDVGEQRSLEELELAGAGGAVLLDDFGPGDVGGHQVGRELAAAEQGDEQFLDDLVLADDDATELLLDVAEGVAEFLDGLQVALSEVLGAGNDFRNLLLAHATLVEGKGGFWRAGSVSDRSPPVANAPGSPGVRLLLVDGQGGIVQLKDGQVQGSREDGADMAARP